MVRGNFIDHTQEYHMRRVSPLINFWEMVKETDLRPMREAALRGVKLALVGDPDSGREALLEAMRHDPARPGQETLTQAALLTLDQSVEPLQADLIILMMDSRKNNSEREQALVQEWHGQGKKVLVFIHDVYGRPALPSSTPGVEEHPTPAAKEKRLALRLGKDDSVGGKRRRGVVWGSITDEGFMTQRFAPAVLELIPDLVVPLARAFPLFRLPTARKLINDTSFTNARYAFGTAVVETIGIADLPIVVADSFILTKNQLFLVYKLGLALGFSTRWQDYVAEFGGVLGSGYLLRLAARTLVGLVPVIGIVPKAGIAYAGTAAVGNAVLQWYLTGRHVTKEQLKTFYQQGLVQAKRLGSLVARAPRPRLPKLLKAKH
jgi:uncharacterized protein (DUF697 family)